MIYIKKYYKYVLPFVFLGIFIFIILSNNDKNESEPKEYILKSTTTSSVKEEHSDIKTIYVDVKGAVNNPGVYEIEEGKRVMDAINLAGGLLDKSDTINLNLSKKLTDEMYIVVYTKDEIYNYEKNKNSKECPSFECVCPDTKNDACISKTEEKNIESNNKKVSINNASKEQLMTLPGIGEAKANSVIEYRTSNGDFKAIEEIKNVSGIGDLVFEKIKDYITL